MGVSVGVSVGADVSVGTGVDVSVGGGVNVAVGGKLVDVETAMGEEEAGGCPELLDPHAAVIKVKIARNIYVEDFMC